MNYLSELNPQQKAAVTSGLGPMLILAGAGSGKTRVLIYRIAYMIRELKVHPTEIFAVTFTNKAAAEMRKRVQKLLFAEQVRGMQLEDLWVSTFHSACVRILRSDIHHLGMNNQFTIYDDGDQLSLIKACMKELNVNEAVLSPKVIQGRINKLKNDGIDSANYQSKFGGPVEDAFVRVFERYAEALKLSSALDFGDLILKTVQLFSTVPSVLAKYQQRFSCVLIDEYQDTNKCQYLLVKLLAGSRKNICAVGDEDQSIYRWRGADITNILNFERDYPDAKIFKLEQNYRSTRHIIEAASHVISYNSERRDKSLWTENQPGEKIRVYESYDEYDEAQRVISGIEGFVHEGYSLDEIAIFYRTNAQSRILEDQLRSKGIAYQIYGGLKFYERLEVKDALAYLRLVMNPTDDVSFRRIVNVPARGIGATSLEKLVGFARKQNTTLLNALEQLCADGARAKAELGRSAKSYQAFLDLIQKLQATAQGLLPSDFLNVVLEESGYRNSLSEEGTVEAQSRLENLAQLRQSMVEYELRAAADDPNKDATLTGFLESIALASDLDKQDPDAPALRMMTIHMAKGLEFDGVFIVGLEEELFPSIRPWEGEEASEVEEERRLFYVGMTRARKELRLLYAKNRTVFGVSHFRVESRFIGEIPEQFIEMHKADYFSRRRPMLERPGAPGNWGNKNTDAWDAESSAGQSDDPAPSDFGSDDYSQLMPDEAPNLKPGSKVMHPAFGEGVVRQFLGGDKVIIEFSNRRIKKISLRFVMLQNSPG